MKAVILAAGKGVRLLPLTSDRPKPLIDVNGRPFLDYLIDHLRKSGINELCFVVGYQKEKMIDYFLKNDIKCDIVIQQEQKGTGHALSLVEDCVKDQNFILVMGDNLYSSEDLGAMQKEDDLCYVAAKEVDNPEKYGVLVEDAGFLVEIQEKPVKAVNNLINSGLYKLTPEIFDALRKIKKSPRGEYELTDALTLLAKERKVKIMKLSSFWLDMGTKQDLEKIKAFLAK